MKLNWGAGPVVAEGWVNADRDPYPGLDHVGDIADGLPWGDGTFTVVVTHHALQMLTYQQLVPALAELRRVLRPNGVLRVSVPDLALAWRAYATGDAAHFLVDDAIERSLDGKLCAYLSQCSSTRSVFTGPWLCELVRRVGFLDAWLSEFGQTITSHGECVALDSRPAESVFVEAVK